ncbi:SDR family NAD(P)-dependent oxidoreductase [Aidingimonas halophila]|uniref:3-oxoacyl-[acyl-carrier protein] reductase n=1 Tax=Aidingimonas halophila TaxID=574349 RepID=A0A1H2X3C4_9GAMM|nr:3-oxoacyl-ACP reductase FabG [Aidingimonas halophila]GHC28007.1 beta-ketoacyl-ACP reductase [Aidingimonas halophila]SDW86994.1 3-oxoacyl-[acyl-carrier protein] reductase [Aidingimonas halophila]
MTASLNGLRVLVTGGSRGIGRAICLSLAAAGARAAFVYHGDREAAAVTLNELQKHDASAFAVDADVSQEASVVAMMSQVIERLGGLDVVVNNAGILHEAGLLETSTESFDAVIGVNLRGTFLVGREAIRQMVAQGCGRVINIASDLGYLGRERNSAYCASKAGIGAMTRSWAREFAPHILVNAVAPGPVDTDMLGADVMSEAQREKESDIPLGRIGRPEEVAAVVRFLAGPEATFITGQTYGVNGGSSMI